ncbi:MAG: feruloyl-CoA synthase [Vicinamibacterales bacterium]
MRRSMFAPAAVEVERRDGGLVYLRSPQPLGPTARCLTEWLVSWGARVPDRPLLAERDGDRWRTVTYGQALDAARRLAQALLDLGLSAGRPLAILSDNSVDHGLLMLGALHVGVPVVPVSPAYSLLSSDHAKLRHIVALVEPGLVWTSDPEAFAPALAAVGAPRPPTVAELLDSTPGPAVDRAHAAVGPGDVAKVLFTSGSTGAPKGVINTHGMLTSNQQMLAQGWPFLERRPPVVVDWLPWNHTFGGNHNFNLVLRNGGTLYIDGGRPVPGRIEVTARNLTDVSPTLYFNVPRGFDLLLPCLERDASLRRRFFHDLDAVFYAAAALPDNLWRRLAAVAAAETGGRLAMLSGWGSTETSPLATQVHFPIERADVIGLPVAGATLKLVPAGDKLEVRVRGPHVTPGYFRQPHLTAEAFDDEGFYRIGDAVRFADPADPARGLVFDGRVAEDFKLSTGTWVSAGTVRVRLVAAADPLVQDAVVTGHDRDEVGALVFLSAAARALGEAELHERLAAVLRALAAEGAGSAATPGRLLVLEDPPSIDGGEITDKGYINQRAVRARRQALVDRLYDDGPGVIRP